MFAEQSASHSMLEVPRTQRPVSRTQFWSAGEVVDMNQKTVSVNEPQLLPKTRTWR